MRYTVNTPLVAATAVREADKNFQEHILEASTAPPTRLTAVRNEYNPPVKSRKHLPLKMIISEMASRDKNTVEKEPAHQTVHNTSLCMDPIKEKCPGRCFPKKSFAEPADDAVNHGEHTFLSDIFKGPGKEVAGLDCQTIFPETSHSSKGDETCSKCRDVKKLHPHGYYSTPRSNSRFHCLYGNEVLNKIVISGELTGPQINQAERRQWLNNDDEDPYAEKYKNVKKPDLMCKHSNVNTGYEYDTEDANNNASLKQYLLDYSPTNIGSPTFIKHVHESTNATNISCSPLSSTYSSVNLHSDWSMEDEYEHANYKRKLDSEYTSENRFLHPLVKFKSKQQDAEKTMTDLLYTVQSTNMSNWKTDCKYTVDDLQCITPNTNQRYSTQNLSSISGNCDSDTLHDAVASSADPTCWYRVKYTRRTQTIRISTKTPGLPESKPRDQIPTALQQTDCSPPLHWNSLSQNNGLNIPYLSSPEDESHELPTSEDLVFTDETNQA